MKCPECGSENTHRTVERSEFILYLCYACEHWFKFYPKEKVAPKYDGDCAVCPVADECKTVYDEATKKVEPKSVEQIKCEKGWAALSRLSGDLADAAHEMEDGDQQKVLTYHLAEECGKLAALIGRAYGW